MTTAPRDSLLDGAAGYVLEHGFSGLSLRPLARALGTSDRMLLYHFGSKEELTRKVMRRLDEQLAAMIVPPTELPRDLAIVVRALWGVLMGGQAAPYVRSYVELIGLAQHEPELYAAAVNQLTRSWTDFLAAMMSATPLRPADRVTAAALILGTLDGLFLYGQASGDAAATEAAVDRFAAGIDGLFEA